MADLYFDNLRILSAESRAPELMVMRLPGFAAQSVLLAFIVCALLILVDKLSPVSSVGAFSVAAVCCGFLSWGPFYLQISFIASEIKAPVFSPVFEFYGSIVVLILLIIAVGWMIYRSGSPNADVRS
ncbi:hypothetical protein [Microbacterium sp. lyk4-40-TSB-66]|uniref:hypothetical protein n=1 Tax=Microbacterium sp. lyk4-40-TSB-66 TaxID=3040294 RepID=UPI00254EF8AF|nr:hypothetical protein [Microbacterium sp. lyk4-40-TSB-66]